MPQIVDRMVAARDVSAGSNTTAGSQVTNTESPKQTDAGVANPGQEAKTPDAQRLEALVRREKALQRERQALAREKQQGSQQTQLQQQLEALRRENSQIKGFVQRFYREPVQVLNEAGVHGDVITQGLLNGGSREAVSIRSLQAQIAQISEQNKALETKLTEGQQAQYDQAKNQIRNDAKMLTLADTADYEAIKAQGDDAVEAVVELIEQTFEKEDRLMSVKEAADEVENFLIEEAVKLSGLGKVKAKLGQASTTGTAPGGQPASSQGPTTLSNRGLPPPAAKGRVSEKERVQRAIAAFNAAKA
jgi:hypothetical protein